MRVPSRYFTKPTSTASGSEMLATRNKSCENPCPDANGARVALAAQAKRLKHAPGAMVEMQAEREHRRDVDERDPPRLEVAHHILIHLALDEAGMNRAGGEIQDVEDDKQPDKRAAPAHRTAGDGRIQIALARVAHGPCRAVLLRQLHRRNDMQDTEASSTRRMSHNSCELRNTGAPTVRKKLA